MNQLIARNWVQQPRDVVVPDQVRQPKFQYLINSYELDLIANFKNIAIGFHNQIF